LAGYNDGGSHTIEFHSIITGSLLAGAGFTNFFVDDISVNVTATDCPQPTGACCLPDGSCTEVTEEDCEALNGDYGGDNTLCFNANCPQPLGACCLPDGSCAQVTEEDCNALNGDFNGDFSLCVDADCPQPPGACCLPDGSCVEVTEEDCGALGGAYNGDFSLCVNANCPQPCFSLTLDDGGFSHGSSAENIVGPGSLVGVDGVSNNASNCNPGTSGTALVFNSTSGPFNQDPDLHVNLGNVMILQSNAPGVANPNDDEDGGTLTFTFSNGVQPGYIDLIDVDAGAADALTVTLTDGSGRTRVYSVPSNWTGDVTLAQPGWGRLDLQTTLPQPGPLSGNATANTGAGYDPNDVRTIVVRRGGCGSSSSGGSGAVDNLTWCE
jgi:hypothetical protein